MTLYDTNAVLQYIKYTVQYIIFQINCKTLLLDTIIHKNLNFK